MLLAIGNAPPPSVPGTACFHSAAPRSGCYSSAAHFCCCRARSPIGSFRVWLARAVFWRAPRWCWSACMVRLTIAETPVFQDAPARGKCLRLPMPVVVRATRVRSSQGSQSAWHPSSFLMIMCALWWGTGPLGYSRDPFLLIQPGCVLGFAGATPVSALLAERGRRRALLADSALAVFGFRSRPCSLPASAA